MYTASLQIIYYIGPRLVILQVMKVDNRNHSDHLTVGLRSFNMKIYMEISWKTLKISLQMLSIAFCRTP